MLSGKLYQHCPCKASQSMEIQLHSQGSHHCHCQQSLHGVCKQNYFPRPTSWQIVPCPNKASQSTEIQMQSQGSHQRCCQQSLHTCKWNFPGHPSWQVVPYLYKADQSKVIISVIFHECRGQNALLLPHVPWGQPGFGNKASCPTLTGADWFT